MRRVALLVMIVALAASCGDSSKPGKGPAGPGDNTGAENSTGAGTGNQTTAESGAASAPGTATGLPAGAVLIASDIVTEVVIRPDPEGDPWEVEKVAGYKGQTLVDGIFSRIYDGTLTVYDYHSGEPLTPADIKKTEAEFKNDRSKIGKISFTEDWYYFPEENRVEKRAKSVTFGYELYNNMGKVYAYRAAFRADLN